jgi:hypothetical protein
MIGGAFYHLLTVPNPLSGITKKGLFFAAQPAARRDWFFQTPESKDI